MWCSRYSSCVSLLSVEAGCFLEADRKDCSEGLFYDAAKSFFSGKISTFTMNCSDLKCFFCLTVYMCKLGT